MNEDQDHDFQSQSGLDASGEPSAQQPASDLAGFVEERLAGSGDGVDDDVRGGRWWRDARRRRYLVVADSLALTTAVLICAGVERGLWEFAFLPVAILFAKIIGLYDRDHREIRHLTVDESPGLLVWAALSAVALGLLGRLFVPAGTSYAEIIQAVLIAFTLAFVFRATGRALWRLRTQSEQVLIVGRGDLASAFRRKITLFDDLHMSEHTEDSSRIDWVVIASERLDAQEISAVSRLCREHEAKLSVVSPLRGQATPQEVSSLAELSIFGYGTADVSRSTLLLKRVLDLVVGIPLAMASLLVAIPVAVAIRLEGPGPILFRQERVGLDRRVFTIWKFRTMRAGAADELADLVPVEQLEDPMFKLRSDPRVTKVGRVLRRFSLDEIPQVWNLIKGDMSLVGPRPEEIAIVSRYSPEHMFRLSVKPGLTGPMQVYGRGELTFPERLAVELDYVERLSIGRDLRIIALTPLAVIRGKGAF